jgi:hypothetical protein
MTGDAMQSLDRIAEPWGARTGRIKLAAPQIVAGNG